MRLKKNEKVRTVVVDTPKGKRVHGYIMEKRDGSVCFYREVRESNDLMLIFDSWSINPQAWDILKDSGISELMYNDVERGKVYYISIEDMKSLVDTNKAFERVFKGGRTIYIPRKFWKIKYTTIK